MIKRPYLSVIIPAYNEVKRLPFALIDIDKHLSKVKYHYEVIVINDGSTDDTAGVVKRFSGIIKNLRLIDNKTNKGKGGVVRQGMLEASGDYRLFTDADNSTSVDQFEKMIPFLEKGYDVVIGSRDVEGSRLSPPQPWYRRIAGNAGNLFIQIMLLPGIWDTQCGFKCFSKEAALKIFPLQRINGWGFDIEILSLAKRLKYKVKEIPVVWINDPNSQVGLSAYIKVLLETVKIRLWLWQDIYKLKSGNLERSQ
ncbi:MAG: glycosyltransferase family 2 protein [Candidatus Colwellbacteria bacterium]|nr:glycosyltransferase family 2 protein [Candidatus Colwellbacteria bacterium]